MEKTKSTFTVIYMNSVHQYDDDKRRLALRLSNYLKPNENLVLTTVTSVQQMLKCIVELALTHTQEVLTSRKPSKDNINSLRAFSFCILNQFSFEHSGSLLMFFFSSHKQQKRYFVIFWDSTYTSLITGSTTLVEQMLNIKKFRCRIFGEKKGKLWNSHVSFSDIFTGILCETELTCPSHMYTDNMKAQINEKSTTEISPYTHSF